jgi:hypothetical protein
MTGVPWRSPALIAILAATLMTPMDVPLVSPALPEVQAMFGVSNRPLPTSLGLATSLVEGGALMAYV